MSGSAPAPPPQFSLARFITGCTSTQFVTPSSRFQEFKQASPTLFPLSHSIASLGPSLLFFFQDLPAPPTREPWAPPEVDGEAPAASQQTLVELFRVPLMTKVCVVEGMIAFCLATLCFGLALLWPCF